MWSVTALGLSINEKKLPETQCRQEWHTEPQHYSATTLNIRTSAGSGFEAASWKYDTRPPLPHAPHYHPPPNSLVYRWKPTGGIDWFEWFNSEKKNSSVPLACLYLFLCECISYSYLLTLITNNRFHSIYCLFKKYVSEREKKSLKILLNAVFDGSFRGFLVHIDSFRLTINRTDWTCCCWFRSKCKQPSGFNKSLRNLSFCQEATAASRRLHAEIFFPLKHQTRRRQMT